MWDLRGFIVYMTHFVVPFVVAGLLWKYAHDRFRRFLVLFVLLTFAALLTYALYPAVPPWMASQNGFLPPTAKIIDEMWTHVRLAQRIRDLLGDGALRRPGGGGAVAPRRLSDAARPLLLDAGRPLALVPAAVPARDGVQPRVHRRALRDRRAARLAVRGVVFVVGNRLYDRYEQRRARAAPADAASLPDPAARFRPQQSGAATVPSGSVVRQSFACEYWRAVTIAPVRSAAVRSAPVRFARVRMAPERSA